MNKSTNQLVKDQITLLVKKVKEKPDADVFYQLGWCYSCLKKIDEAIEAFNQGLRINPSHSMIYYRLSNVYRWQGENTKAIEAYTKAIEVDASNEMVYRGLSIAYFKEGEYGSGLEAINQGLSVFPESKQLRDLISIVVNEDEECPITREGVLPNECPVEYSITKQEWILKNDK